MERKARQDAQRREATGPPVNRLKSYATPRLTEHGKVATATADSAPPSELPPPE